MSDVEVLESVLAKDEKLIAAIGADQWTTPTRCPEYDVRALVNHIVGYLQMFEAGANGRTLEGDPASFVSQDPVTDFQAAAAGVLTGWRTHGVDRTIHIDLGDLPGQMVLTMMLTEYLTHGCDLAAATGQAVPFSDAEIETAFDRVRPTLPDQFRGEGQPFGEIIEVPEDAPMLDRFLGFMGRRV